MGVFDALIIQTPPGVPDVELARPEGPLERGHFDDAGTWIPATDPQRLDIPHFGIDPDGDPYYDEQGVAAGDEAALWIDPVNTQLWLQADRGPSYVHSILAEASLAGYWRVGERTGTVAADQAHADPGAYVGGVTLGQPGALGASGDSDTAVLFDGASGYVDVPDAPRLQIASAIALEAWVRVTDRAGFYMAISKGDDYRMFINHVDGHVHFDATSQTIGAASTNPVPLNEWAHIVATFDGATIRHYLNGQPNGTVAATGAIATSSAHLNLGSENGSSNWFKGSLDEAAVYGSALPAGHVAAHFQAATRAA